MYARVARWEGAEADTIRAAADGINAEASSGPPEASLVKVLLLLIDPDGGRSMAISLFETEEDLRKGDERHEPARRRHGASAPRSRCTCWPLISTVAAARTRRPGSA